MPYEYSCSKFSFIIKERLNNNEWKSDASVNSQRMFTTAFIKITSECGGMNMNERYACFGKTSYVKENMWSKKNHGVQLSWIWSNVIRETCDLPLPIQSLRVFVYR